MICTTWSSKLPTPVVYSGNLLSKDAIFNFQRFFIEKLVQADLFSMPSLNRSFTGLDTFRLQILINGRTVKGENE